MGPPTLHMDHGIPIAVNVGDAMLSMSLQPLLDNVERSGSARPWRRARCRAHDPQDRGRSGDGTEWVRLNTWQLDDADYLAMVELRPVRTRSSATAGRYDCGSIDLRRPAAHGVVRSTSGSGVGDHRRPAEPAGGPGGRRLRNRRRPLGRKATSTPAGHTAFCRASTIWIGAGAGDGQRRPGDGLGENELAALLGLARLPRASRGPTGRVRAARGGCPGSYSIS